MERNFSSKTVDKKAEQKERRQALTSKRHRCPEADQRFYSTERECQRDSKSSGETNRRRSARRTASAPDRTRRRTPEAKATASTRPHRSARCSIALCLGSSNQDPNSNRLDYSSTTDKSAIPQLSQLKKNGQYASTGGSNAIRRRSESDFELDFGSVCGVCRE